MWLPTTFVGAFLHKLNAGKGDNPVDVSEPIRALYRERMALPATINITINLVAEPEETPWPIQ